MSVLLRQLSVPALEEDSCRVMEAISDGPAQIDSLSALNDTLEEGGPDAIILIQRAALAAAFLAEIYEDLRTSSIHNEDALGRWNVPAGYAAENAVPHVHDFYNCHAAPTPTDCPTGFFRHRDMVRAVEEVGDNKQLPPYLTWQLRDALSLRDVSGDEAFYLAIHNIRPSRACSEIALLQCVELIQRNIRKWNGAFEASLAADGYGIVTIPAWCVHGRSLRKQFVRREPTGWRYFGEKSSRTAFTSLSLDTTTADPTPSSDTQ